MQQQYMPPVYPEEEGAGGVPPALPLMEMINSPPMMQPLFRGPGQAAAGGEESTTPSPFLLNTPVPQDYTPVARTPAKEKPAPRLTEGPPVFKITRSNVTIKNITLD